MASSTATGSRYRALLDEILGNCGLDKPDGRPLHAYRLSETQYDDLQLYCTTAQPKPEGLFAALFVLWASEHFRSSYDGSGLRWAFLTDALERKVEWSLLSEITGWGLKYWKRPLRVGEQHRLFLQSLLVEGGIPEVLLKTEGRYRAQILKLIEAAEQRSGMAREALPRLVTHMTAGWPEGFRQSDVSELVADFVLGLVEARKRVPGNIPKASSADWLDGRHPGWRDELPIRIGPAAAQSLLDEALRAERRPSTHKDFALRMLRRNEDGIWLPYVEFPEQASIDRGAISRGPDNTDHQVAAIRRAVCQSARTIDPRRFIGRWTDMEPAQIFGS